LAAGTAAGGVSPGVSLDDVIEAHGGEKALRALRGYSARIDVSDIQARQSPTPEPPRAPSASTRCLSLDLADENYAQLRRDTAGDSYPVHSALWLTSAKGPIPAQKWYFNLRDGWREARTPGATREHITRAMRLAPTLLVRGMAETRDKVTPLGETDGPEASRTHFRYEPATGPAFRLAFDNRTRMLRELESEELSLQYDGYEIVDGFPVSRRMKLERNGTGQRMHLKEATFGRNFQPVPDALWNLPVVEPRVSSEARRFRNRTVAPGIHLIGEDDRYQLFVEFRDFVVALGGADGVDKRLEALRSVAGGKPLRYALITRHHPEHLAGVPALVDAGAVLIISPGHETAVRAAAGPQREPRLATVSDRSEITDGDRVLVFQALGPTHHAEHTLAAWLPAEKLLFSSDLFIKPPGRPVRTASLSSRELYRAIQRSQMDATRFVDPRSPDVPNLADLKLAVNKPVTLTEFGEVATAVCPP
jgi:glyoxylase-like metal-dependent hydrolase (beta-lactamase superfamily II)